MKHLTSFFKNQYPGKTIKLLEGNIDEYLHDLGIGKEFLNRIQKALTIKGRKSINWTTLKLRTFEQRYHKRVKHRPQSGRRYLQ